MISCPGIPGWLITDSVMQAIGFPLAGFQIPDGVAISFNAIVNCNLNSSLPLPQHNFVFHNFCGDSNTAVVFDNDPVNIVGSSCTDCFSVFKSVDADTVIAILDTVTYTIEVCANNGSEQIIHLNELLPVNFSVITSNLPLIDTLSADTCVIYTVSGIFTLGGSCVDNNNIVQVISSNDTITDNACVTVYPNCFSWSYIFIPDSALASSYPLVMTGDTLFIDGVFIIDTTLSLMNCMVYANSGAQIIVNSGDSLLMDSTTIQGCDQMWRGIYLEEKATVEITEMSVLRDADIAVFASNKSTHAIKQSYIEDCVRGIYLPPSTGMNSIGSKIYGSWFGMFAPALKPHFAGQAPFGEIPFSGIELNDVVLTIGNAAQDSNFFYKLNTGILGFRSALIVENNKFDSIRVDTAIATQPWHGTAIVSEATATKPGRLDVYPVSSHAWTIDHSERGVYASNTQVLVDRINMAHMQVGVYSQNTYRATSVVNCWIEARRYGIDYRLNAGASSMYAGYNKIIMAGSDFSIGINMEELSTAGDPNYLIEENYNIDITSGYAGIRARNVYDPQILKNSIHQRTDGITAPNTFGILLENDSTGLVECNTIINHDILYTSTWGMRVSSTKGTTIMCNEVDSSDIGFNFQDVSPVDFIANTMRNNFRGLEIDTLSAIGTQTNKGNNWINYRDTVGAVNWFYTPLGLNASEFQTSGALFSNLWPAIPSWDNGWFTSLPGTEQRCSQTCTANDLIDTTRDESFERSISQGAFNSGTINEENQVVTEQYLFELLAGDSVMLQSEIDYEEFYAEHKDGVAGKIQKATYHFKNALKPDSSYQNAISTIDSLWNEHTISIMELDRLEMITPQLNYDTQRGALTDQIASLLDNIAVINFQQQLVSQASLDSAMSYNNSISSPVLPHVNQQFLNQIHVQFLTFGNESLIPYLDQILSIATQCPTYGGPAVFGARTLMALFNDSINYENACAQVSSSRKRPNSENSLSKHLISIIPNPADKNISIVLSQIYNGICQIEIINPLGEVVLKTERNCKEKSMSMNTAMLKPGVYSVKVMFGESTSNVMKLVIAR